MKPAPLPRPGKRDILVLRALYSYTAQNPDELSFSEGDILYVLNKDDPNWLKCKTADREGMVPSNYGTQKLIQVGENTAEIENPLHEAAKRGNLEFAKELVSAGCSVNLLDKAQNTPLHWAARGGHSSIVELLLSKNCLINAQNALGDTPLHLAAWGGHLAVAQLLTSAGADLFVKNRDSKTAFEIAKDDQVAYLLGQSDEPEASDDD